MNIGEIYIRMNPYSPPPRTVMVLFSCEFALNALAFSICLAFPDSFLVTLIPFNQIIIICYSNMQTHPNIKITPSMISLTKS